MEYKKMYLHTMDCVVINKCMRKYSDLIKDFIKDALEIVKKDNTRAFDGNHTHAFLAIYADESDYRDCFTQQKYRKKYHTNLTEIDKMLDHNSPEYQEFYNKIKQNYESVDHSDTYTNFTIKYDGILQDTLGTDFIDTIFRNGSYYSISPKYCDGLLEYIDYIKENMADIDLIDKVLQRIVQLDIHYFYLSPDCYLDGKKNVDFYFKRRPNRSAGYRTLLAISDGDIVEKNTTDPKNFNYSTADSHYAMVLTITPGNSMDFDLENNRGYYIDKINKRVSNNSENIKVESLTLNTLAFDPASLPASITLNETLYHIFPELKKRIECNLVVHDCEQINKEIISNFKKLENLSSFNIEGLTEQQCSGLKKQYLEMHNLLLAMADAALINYDAIDNIVVEKEETQTLSLENDNK